MEILRYSKDNNTTNAIVSTALSTVSFMHHVTEAEDVRWHDSDCNKCSLSTCACQKVDLEELFEPS